MAVATYGLVNGSFLVNFVYFVVGNAVFRCFPRNQWFQLPFLGSAVFMVAQTLAGG